jgi:adenine-specific DNA-methyltransferase
MPSAEQLRSRLLKKLSELFQLDQPDLDFGFYRIMHAKAREVQDFIGTDLLKIVAEHLVDVDEAGKAKLRFEYEKAIQTAKAYGVLNPEEAEPVKKVRAELDAVKDTAGAEADVYDHLYRFFERYYDDGDFISRRYYTRETSGKAAPFAVPYNGEEIKLHWANADQYYIKSAEYFFNFTFDLRQARETRDPRRQNPNGILPVAGNETPLKVHFRIVDATEGEHGNLKASEANKRFFILHADKPVALTETGELVVNFEYRPDPEKNGQESAWRDKCNTEAVEAILGRLQAMAAAGGEHKQQVTEYLRLLEAPAPTESDKKRPLLGKYVNQYTARNTMDYFIHKDLGGFLRRELDFYIKNEVMHLDDIENAEAPAVEGYLAKIKALRKIAGKLIDFLAQLEDFQKKLWLKKKFIVETNYCLTLDRVPEELHEEAAANEAQVEEWIKLFAIDEIQADMHNQKISRPLTVDFLRANNKLVLDTGFFDENFKARLLASIENFDEQCDGLLIHSENFQALNLLRERYREQVKCVYIDPPYNTAASEILYKNSYKHSSWCSLLQNRIEISKQLLKRDGIFQTAIDDAEFHRLECVIRLVFGDENYIANIAVMQNPKGRDQKHIADCHEYTVIAAKDVVEAKTYRLKLKEEEFSKKFSKKSDQGCHRELPLRRSGSGARRADRPYMFFPFIYDSQKDVLSVIPRVEYENIYSNGNFNDAYVDELKKKYTRHGFIFILPIRDDGSFGRWRWGYDSSERGARDRVLFAKINGRSATVYQIDEADETYLPKSLWYGERYDASTKGTNILKSIIPQNAFYYPKSIFVVEDMLVIGSSDSELILDFFAGSGTTGHAVINLNRVSESAPRKYILVEMGDHFDSVLKPRIAKIAYSESWKNGKPVARHTGISHCFKYIRLESYEDTLNNLRFDQNLQRAKAIAVNPTLKEDYMLRYFLDVETRGSQSLLNVDGFADPTAYTLEVKKPGTDECTTRTVDLIETFNYLIGLRVLHTAVPQAFQAAFKRITDPELPEDQHAKLAVDGHIRQDPEGSWWFRKVEGWLPKDSANPDNGQREKVLIVWRRLTGDIERDNLMLDEWFQKNRGRPQDFGFGTIYVNGSNNLPNLKRDDENWQVRLIEEEFMKRMWNCDNT